MKRGRFLLGTGSIIAGSAMTIRRADPVEAALSSADTGPGLRWVIRGWETMSEDERGNAVHISLTAAWRSPWM